MPSEPGLIYAVADVHGHADKLRAMHDAIRRELREQATREVLLVHLGDYVDRGPDSAEVLALLAAGPPIAGVPTVNLMGNHEAMLLGALDRGSELAVGNWLYNGGLATLESWGVDLDSPAGSWASQIPPEQLAFVRGLALHHSAGGYLFVHAGVRPGVPLARQISHDLLWIREPFLSWGGVLLPEAPELVIVHGHTPVPQPEVRPNRIGLDTGAGAGRALTCAVLGDGPPRFLQI